MIKINCETKDFLKLEDITPFQGGLKIREESDHEKVIKSIRKHGFSAPFYIWEKDGINYCLDGHNRIESLQRLVASGEELPPLPVVYVHCKDEADAKELLLKINSTYGKMTAESVKDFIGDLDIEIDDLALPDGFLDLNFEIDDIDAETKGDDEAPEVNEEEEPDSKPGEMYELGNSILMCGDSTSAEDVSRLMGGEKADMVFTDPPYNVDYADKNSFLNEIDKGNHIQKDIKNDAFENDEECAKKLWLPAFRNLYENAKDKCSIYVTMPQGGAHMMMMMMMIQESGWQVKHELVWVKNNHVLGRVDYFYKHEPILYGWKKTHKWVGKGKFNKSVWEIPKPNKSDLHPTMKPIELIENALLNSSEKNDLVLDLFGGSGSTLIACEKNNRKTRVMEVTPNYCDVIRKRWTKWAKENGREVGSGGLE